MRQTFTHMLNHQREYTTKLPLSAYRGLLYQLKTFALVPFINKAPMVLSCTWVLGDSAHSLGVRGRQGCHMRTKRYDATMHVKLVCACLFHTMKLVESVPNRSTPCWVASAISTMFNKAIKYDKLPALSCGRWRNSPKKITTSIPNWRRLSNHRRVTKATTGKMLAQ